PAPRRKATTRRRSRSTSRASSAAATEPWTRSRSATTEIRPTATAAAQPARSSSGERPELGAPLLVVVEREIPVLEVAVDLAPRPAERARDLGDVRPVLAHERVEPLAGRRGL